MRIKMCSIHVTDPASAFDFYTTVLGFQSLLAMPEANLFIVTTPDSGGVGLLLEPSDNPVAEAYRRGVHDAGLPAIVLGSPDVVADYERLRDAGLEFRGEPAEDPSGISAVFDDRHGNWIQLHQD
ncbi:VOC family protein [Sinomonas atrocyanea]|jgi:catechol 2,3-dioxygenase-like lactoylglutathione lyase family enzyme|uniref:VOC family protein n=1 Tax=Sinomonas atrocyanea TaxID=37927 RepID=UPI00277DD0A0|nr:VOC family protein [Sinomonas atrocyanea]MDQ0261627.1 catechol 2,3-dioxygenase-like lactoylglutathione lyase family enzyme [Sinomonas atrocyanea]MDR6621514.1 catechol 2,3-dioxygenase-like lactoylglutathione lyase family enzyme [Sinomonas atrocyanea]